jgi:hypothetical protein
VYRELADTLNQPHWGRSRSALYRLLASAQTLNSRLCPVRSDDGCDQAFEVADLVEEHHELISAAVLDAAP